MQVTRSDFKGRTLLASALLLAAASSAVNAADPSFGTPSSGVLPAPDSNSPRSDNRYFRDKANAGRDARAASRLSRNTPSASSSYRGSGYGGGPQPGSGPAGYPSAPGYAGGSNYPGAASYPASSGYPATGYSGSGSAGVYGPNGGAPGYAQPASGPAGYSTANSPAAGYPNVGYAVPAAPAVYPPPLSGLAAPAAATVAGYPGAVYGGPYYAPATEQGIPSIFAPLAAGLTGEGGPGPDWSGLYVGATIGKGKSDIQRYWPATDHWAPAGTSIGQEADGTIGGMVIGFNQQLGGFVVGVDALVLANKFSKTERSPAPSTVGSDPVYINYDLKELYMVSARAGLAIGQFLPYVKAGAAFGKFTTYTHDSDAGGVLHWGDTSEMQKALVLGGGVEMLIGQNLVLGIEYQRIDFRPTTHYLSTVSGTGIASPVHASSDVSAKIDLLTARLSLKFPPLAY